MIRSRGRVEAVACATAASMSAMAGVIERLSDACRKNRLHMPLIRLTPHFSLHEIDCHDGTHVPDDLVLSYRHLCERVLEPLRHRFGVCTVVSGYRPPSYN